MNDVLRELLWLIAQHQAKDDFIAQFDCEIPTYKEGMSLEEYGAKCAVASGRKRFQQKLIDLLRSND
jgi:hypothetical protein